MGSSKDDSATDGDKSTANRRRPDSNSNLYSDGEKVLAYHGPRIYEAKVQKAEIRKNEWKYFVHYLGWNKNWDEWVGVDRLMKYTEENIQKQQALDKKQVVDKNPKSGRSTQTKPKILNDVKVEKEDVKNSGTTTPRVTRSKAKASETVHEESDLHSHPEGEGSATLKSIVKEAITDEVYNFMQNVLPSVVTEVIKAVKDGEKADKKGKENEKNFGRSTGRTEESKEEPSNPKVVVHDDDSDEESERETTRGCNYGAFQMCKPPTFDGNGNATAAHRWVREMEAVLEISECREDQKVKFATHSFVDSAYWWWDNIVQAEGKRSIAKLKWSELKELVLEEYCPHRELDKIKKEFLYLEAGNMTHQEYTFKFNDLARLVPDMVTPVSKKIKRYIQGLPVDIRRHMITARPDTFRSVVDLAGRLYDERDPMPIKKKVEKWSGNKNVNGKRFGGNNFRSGEKRLRVEDQSGRRRNTDEEGACRKCGKGHSGECRVGTGKCFKCGGEGHYARDCKVVKCYQCGEMGHLERDCRKEKSGGSGMVKAGDKGKGDSSKAKARAFNITREEARADPEVVSVDR